MKFKILVPFYNAAPWLEACLNSIHSQTYKNFSCLIIDDCSTDESGKIVDKFLKDINFDSRFYRVTNIQNKKALTNIVDGFKELKTQEEPESVLMIVDGDDKLATPRALEIVKGYYDSRPELLLTYGNHVHSPNNGTVSNCVEFPSEILSNDNYRKFKFVTSHLRTFKSKLWNSINEKDLIDPNTNTYFTSAWDVAFMIPMLEMAGKDRFLFTKDILYVYTVNNPLSDHVVRGAEQGQIDAYVRTLPKYELLKKDI